MAARENILVRLCTILLVIGAVASMWEGIWWHEFINDALVGTPPSAVFHFSVLSALLCAGFAWLTTRRRSWLWVFFSLFSILLSVPLRALWEEAIGVASRSGLLVYWGPVHLLPSIGFVLSSYFLLRFAEYEKFPPLKKLQQGFLFAIIFVSFLIRLKPFRPTGGLHEVLGFWGPSVIVFFLMSVLLFSQKQIRDEFSAQRVVLSVLFLSFIEYVLATATFVLFALPTDPIFYILTGGFRHPPVWLEAAALFIMARILDEGKRLTLVARSTSAGMFYAIVLYGFGMFFIDAAHAYPVSGFLIAVIAAGLGGCIAGVFHLLYEKHS